MSTGTTPPKPSANLGAIVNTILQDAQLAGTLAQPIETAAGAGSDVVAYTQLSLVLLGIIQKAVGALQAQQGQPIDEALLQPFTPLADIPPKA